MVLFSTLFPLEIMSLKQRRNRWERSGCIYKCLGVGSTGPQECLAPRNKETSMTSLDLILVKKLPSAEPLSV